MGKAQVEAQTILEESPSLRRELPAFVARAYDQARTLAARETGLSLGIFADPCRRSPEELLQPAYLPDKLG